MNTTNEKLAQLENLLREIYKDNEGPKLIDEIVREFPHPRKLWNEPCGYNGGGWGMPATCSVAR